MTKQERVEEANKVIKAARSGRMLRTIKQLRVDSRIPRRLVAKELGLTHGQYAYREMRGVYDIERDLSVAVLARVAASIGGHPDRLRGSGLIASRF